MGARTIAVAGAGAGGRKGAREGAGAGAGADNTLLEQTIKC